MLHDQSIFHRLKHLLIYGFIAASVVVSGCNTPKTPVKAPTLRELVNQKPMSDQERHQVVTAAQKRAETELANNNPKAAVHFAKIAAQFDPDNQSTQLLLARAYSAQKEYAEALSILNGLDQASLSASTLELYGLTQFFAGQTGKSAITLQQAIAMDESRWKALAVMGRLYRQNGETQKSMDAFSKALQFSDKPALVYEHQGYAYFENKNWNAALGAFDRARTLSGDNMETHAAYRLAKAKTGDLPGALSLANEFETAQLYQDLGKLALQEGQRIEAVKYLQRAKAASPRYNQETERLLAAAKAMKS